MALNPIEGTKDIVNSYKRYLLTTFQTNIDTLNQQLEEKLADTGAIANGPFISITKPYLKGVTLQQLIDKSNGLLSNTLNDIRPFNKKLYQHQVKAIEKASSGKSIVVTTGTSSGKTECFLIPVINQLLKEKEDLIKSTGNPNAQLPSGVRTLIIYPLNALVNDQLKRLIFDDDTYDNGELRNIFSYLKQCPDIKVGMYIGNTPEDQDSNDCYKFFRNLSGDDDFTLEDFKEKYPNIVLTRDEMRENPPHILITNYTMLEYLLLRPTDTDFFDNPQTNKYWKSIVLDEAHIYDGALGIEISTLLRRVKARIKNDDIQFILTSATLGDESENENILNFANSLCSTKGAKKEFTQECIIRAEYYNAPIATELHNADLTFYDDFSKLLHEYENAGEFIKEDKLDEILNFFKTKKINIEPAEGIEKKLKNIKEVLYNYISHDEFYNYLKNEIIGNTDTYTNKIFSENEDKKSLITLLKEKYNITDNNFINFITTATYASSDEGYNLFESKYHLFLKGFNGIYVTLEPGNEKLYMAENTEDENKNKIFNVSFCSNCNALYVIGNRIEREDGDEYFIQKSYYSENDDKEIFLISSNEYDDEEDDKNKYWLCTKCGKIVPYNSFEENEKICENHDSKTKILIIKIDKNPLLECPCCHARAIGRDIFRPYVVGQSIATSVIGTALYRNIPDHYFKQINSDRKQFLAFSDSRQKAAFFASNMEYSYEKYLKKAVLTQTWLNQFEDKKAIKIKDFIKAVYKKLMDNEIYTKEAQNGYNKGQLIKDAIKCKKQAYISVLDELIGFSKKDSMLNKAIFYFDTDINLESRWDNITDEEFTTYIKIFVMDLIKKGKIGNILDDEDKKDIEIKPKEIDSIYTDEYFPDFLKDKDLWTKNKKTQKINNNKRIKLLKRLLENENITEEEIENYLNVIPRILINEHVLIEEGKNHLRVNLDKIIINSVDKESLYKCSECKTVTPYNIRNICLKSLNHCHGKLKPWTNYKEEQKNNHYKVLYETLPLLSLKAEEHTAQLAQSSAKDVQNRFQKGLTNVLSCSTTFEMGIDLGSLETVFMRNMPPSTSNYTQRAGRAGRGQNSSAFVLTYCLNRSHDLHYFAEPEQMINGKVNPPVFDINNEKIVLRHIFASALSFYWKKHKEYYQRKIDKKFVSNVEIFFGKKNDNIKNPNDFEGYTEFKNYILKEKDEELKKYLIDITKCLNEDLQNKLDIENFAWASMLFEEDDKLENYPGILYSACCEYIETIDNINNVTNIYFNRDSRLKEIINKNTISYLAENNILPKYGFPVDLVTLYTDNCSDLDKVDLQRSLHQAITEYAPDSKIIAKKKLCTSKYIKKNKRC